MEPTHIPKRAREGDNHHAATDGGATPTYTTDQLPCHHSEWSRLIPFDGTVTDIKLTCRVCYAVATFPNESAMQRLIAVTDVVAHEEEKPKRVVHVRNVPQGFSDTDLKAVFEQRGWPVLGLTQHSDRHHAFVEFMSPVDALTVSRAAKIPISSSRTLFCQYAHNQKAVEAKTDDGVGRTMMVTLRRLQCGEGGPLPITPYLVYQMLCTTGPVVKVLVMGGPNDAAACPDVVKALVQFASPDAVRFALPRLKDGHQVMLGEHDVVGVTAVLSKAAEIRSMHNTPTCLVITEGMKMICHSVCPPLMRETIQA
eukprot:PhM_4_TR2812/c0_g1_i1/m.86156